MNNPADPRIVTVGRPSPGVTIRIADDGEILMSGESVFSAYWHNPTATGETLIDGWLHTGDLGELDSDGYLKITGRKKEIIVTAGGRPEGPGCAHLPAVRLTRRVLGDRMNRTFRIGGGPVQPVTGTATTPGDPVTIAIRHARTELVGG